MTMLARENITDRANKVTCRITIFTGLAQVVPGSDLNAGPQAILPLF